MNLEENIVVLEDFGKHSDASWSRFVQSVTPGWKRLFKKKNANATKSPIVVILCASALRAVEVRKYVTILSFYQHCYKRYSCFNRKMEVFNIPVAKLFSRHLSVEAQEFQLSRFCPIAVGTPNRILKLLNQGILDLTGTERIIIDMNQYVVSCLMILIFNIVFYRDSKQFTVLNLKDTQMDVMAMYAGYLHPHLQKKSAAFLPPHLEKNTLQLAFF